MVNDARLRAWLDGLNDDEQATAERVLTMPGGSMAIAYIAVEFQRFRIEARREHATGAAAYDVAAAAKQIAEETREHTRPLRMVSATLAAVGVGIGMGFSYIAQHLGLGLDR